MATGPNTIEGDYRNWDEESQLGSKVRTIEFLRMKDGWNESLRCPICGKTGMASLSQDEDADTPIVQRVPSGFTVVSNQHGPDFHCDTCNVAVQP